MLIPYVFKLKVLFSIIDSGKIDWDKIYIPEGRSKKAVKCMLDISRQSVRNPKTGGNNGGDTANKTAKKTKAAAVGTKRKRAEAQIEDDDEETLLKPVNKSKKEDKTESKDMSKHDSKEEGKSDRNEEDADDEDEGKELIKDEFETDSQATLDDPSLLLCSQVRP